MLAVEMLQWALDNGFPICIVLADSWFGTGPFVEELKRLKLSYVLEIKRDYNHMNMISHKMTFHYF